MLAYWYINMNNAVNMDNITLFEHYLLLRLPSKSDRWSHWITILSFCIFHEDTQVSELALPFSSMPNLCWTFCMSDYFPYPSGAFGSQNLGHLCHVKTCSSWLKQLIYGPLYAQRTQAFYDICYCQKNRPFFLLFTSKKIFFWVFLK